MDEISELYRLGLIRFGEFKLSSGGKSTFYINLRDLPSFPDLFEKIMNMAIEKIDPTSFDFVCGIATGGIPLAAYIAFKLRTPFGYVRIEKKTHGIEGYVAGRAKGRRILLVDDVTTTGASLLRSANILEPSGGKLSCILVIVVRDLNVVDLFEKRGVRFAYLYYAGDIISHLFNQGLITRDVYDAAMRELKK